jgi:hypothetical protein
LRAQPISWHLPSYKRSCSITDRKSAKFVNGLAIGLGGGCTSRISGIRLGGRPAINRLFPDKFWAEKWQNAAWQGKRLFSGFSTPSLPVLSGLDATLGKLLPSVLDGGAEDGLGSALGHLRSAVAVQRGWPSKCTRTRVRARGGLLKIRRSGGTTCPDCGVKGVGYRLGPPGYVAWHEWADKLSKTHDQLECPNCGSLTIWKPKKKGRR